jgi:hypothetical protein
VSPIRRPAILVINVIVDANALVLRRNWVPVIGSLVLFVGGVLIARANYLWVPFGYFAALCGLLFGPVFVIRNAFPRGIHARFRATASGIEVTGHGEHRSEDILEAKLLPRQGDAVVELALRGGKTLALRTTFHEAKALVDVLGARRTRFPLVVPFGWRFLSALVLLEGGSYALAGGDAGRWGNLVVGYAMLACLLAWVVGFVRGRLVVGADGFTTKWLFRQRFIAFRDVASVEGRARFHTRDIGDTYVKLTSGKSVRLRTVEAPNTDEERGAESRAMLAHVKEAFDRSARLMDGSVDIPALVERGSRTAREWLSGIDALVRGGGSRYRVAAVSPDMLADLACDPGAKVESRVGAAAALVRMDDEALRTRVRVSAEACAEPDLRDTLLALVEARDELAVEAALETLRR